MERVDLEFKSARPFYGRYAFKYVIGKVFNSCNYMKELYEENFCYLFPCYEVRYILRRMDKSKTWDQLKGVQVPIASGSVVYVFLMTHRPQFQAKTWTIWFAVTGLKDDADKTRALSEKLMPGRYLLLQDPQYYRLERTGAQTGREKPRRLSRIGSVARESHFEADYSIIWGE